MSQQPWGTAQGSSAGGNTTNTHHDVSSAQPGDAPRATAPRPPPSTTSQQVGSVDPAADVARAPSSMLPPLQRSSGVDDSTVDRRATRSLGVHAILNNPSTESTEPRGVRRSASEMEDRPPDVRQSTLPPMALSRPPSAESGYIDVTSPGGTGSLRGAPRRILTPRSPTLRSVASLGRLSGPGDPHQSPYLSPRSRNYTIEPGSGNVPPLPTPPAGARAGYGFPAPSMSTPPLQPRRTSLESHHGRPGGASPAPSHYPYQPQRPLSPRGSYSADPATSSAQMYQHFGTAMQAGSSAPPVSVGTSSPPYVPISSSGGGNYLILTMPTHKGPVQIPVDVQAASKMADEKRKRNAGASARFRERRKLKEKEATTTIHRLEQQLREATEDADFYHRERDNLAQLLYEAPGGNRHFPRPPSPRRSRGPGTPGSSVGGGDTASASGSGGYAVSESSELPRRPPESGPGERNTRHRTTAYNLPPPPPPHPASSMSPAPAAYSSTYAPITPAPPMGPQHSYGAAPPRYGGASGAPNEPHTPVVNPQLAPRPPVGPVQPPEHERSWPPASHGGPGGPSSYR